ncbi:MAG: LL-diaminopimelate aminotransferase, partial [Oscillibacter sp.]|nr:LL-diaminopimelate aminotransferase [Oscillibacter sp.]
RTTAFSAEHPDIKLIRLGIGDVTRPLAPAVVESMHKAVSEMGQRETFRGYGPEQGYEFLRNAIAEHDFRERGAEAAPDEIFVSDGAKSDCGNIGDIFSDDNIVAVCDPVYPVYVDASAIDGRTGDYLPSCGRWSRVVYMPITAENGFVPELPTSHVDLIYLCSPNNPTGTALTREQLSLWVDYAAAHDAVILFDAAYEAYITEPNIPHSIYEIPGARECAIEFRSFSKTAGFTGTRCAFTVVPKTLVRQGQSLHAMWNRRHTTKFNGVPYVVQRGAEAVYSAAGQRQIREDIAYYQANARTIREGLEQTGLAVYGGVNSPYIWFRAPMDSWDFFDLLLREAYVVTTPGAGFGPSGREYIRVTAFGEADDTAEAVRRMRRVLE